MTQPLVKRPGEVRKLRVPFGAQPELRDFGDTLTGTPTVSVQLAPGFTGALPTLGTPSISGTRVLIPVSGGVDATDYLIKCTVTTSGGSTLEEQVTLEVRAGS